MRRLSKKSVAGGIQAEIAIRNPHSFDDVGVFFARERQVALVFARSAIVSVQGFVRTMRKRHKRDIL